MQDTDTDMEHENYKNGYTNTTNFSIILSNANLHCNHYLFRLAFLLNALLAHGVCLYTYTSCVTLSSPACPAMRNIII